MKKLSTNEIRSAWINFFENYPSLEHKFYKSASLIPDNPTLLLNSAGMVPFIPYFIGATKRPEPPRAVSIQKCARVGGKDSDLSNIGYTQRHHSFFEMLGNFSFGDYFKKEVIPMAWQFVTEVIKLDPQRLYVSVFEGDESRPADKESEKIWTGIFREKNIYPENEIPKRIWKFGAKDNFWGPPGPTGPCGPCSEIYYDLGEHIKEKDDRYIEIWNLVFMEFEKLDDGKLKPLAQKNIDTGAGLERIAMVLQGVNNTFETDELAKLIEATKAEVFKDATVPSKVCEKSDIEISKLICKEEFKPYFKIIVDHLRCACFLIADGVRPSNVSRGYVLRMLIRRAGRFIHKLAYTQPNLLSKLSSVVVEVYGEFYDELKVHQELIENVLRKEEELFAKTIESGLAILKDEIDKLILNNNGEISILGSLLFNLYSTYGLPLEIVEDEIFESNKFLESRKSSIKIDYEGYEKAREEHSKASSTSAFNVSVTSEKALAQFLQDFPKTEFLGYSLEETEAKILAILDENKNPISGINFSEILEETKSQGTIPEHKFFLVLDRTTFYAESGGQVSDSGYILKKIVTADTELSGSTIPVNVTHNLLFRVLEVKSVDNRTLHQIEIELPADSISKDTGVVLAVGDSITAQIDSKKRQLTKLHHSSCHLLQAALRRVLGNTVSQAGSQVSSEYTRFDFNYDSALNKEQLLAVEEQINSWINAALEVKTIETTYDEAIKLGALAFFEDKYEDTVRVIRMGSDTELASVELCGGTHVNNTSEIAKIKIASESSVASGVRRIKLFAKELADKFIQEEKQKQLELEDLEQRKELEKQADNRKKAECLGKLRDKTDVLLQNGKEKDGVLFIIANLNDLLDFNVDSDSLRTFATDLKSKIESQNKQAWIFFIGAFEGKVSILGACSKILSEKEEFKINDIIKSAANICGGGGGGRPDFAQAGAKDISKIPDALNMVISKQGL